MAPSGHASPAALRAVTIAFTVVSAVFVLMRLCTRFILSRNAGWDDLFIIGAMVLSVGLSVCTWMEVKFGFGRHADTLSAAQDESANKALFVSIAFYGTAMFCTKFSILLQYLRIFPHTGFRKACYVLMFVVFAYASWCFWSAIFFCKPVSAFWQGGIAKGQCLNHEAVWFFNAAVNIVTDIATAVLPLPVLHHLQVPKRAKTALMVVFSLGGFTCIVSILRLEALYAVSVSKDQTWDNSLTALWSIVEINTGIVCSCLPTLKACVTRAFPRLFTSGHRSYLTGPNATSQRWTTTHASKNSVKINHDALGRGLSGRGAPMQRIYVGRATPLDTDAFDMYEMDTTPGTIHVTTVVNQEVEKGGVDEYERRSDNGSTKELVH